MLRRPFIALTCFCLIFVLSACFTTTRTHDRLDLYTRSLSYDEEAGFAELDLELVVRGDDLVHLDELQIVGLTPDGSVPLPSVEIGETVQGTASGTRRTVNVKVDTNLIESQAVEKLQVFLASRPETAVVVPLQPSREQGDAGAEDVAGDPASGDEDFLVQTIIDENGVERSTRVLRRGTYQATTLYVIRSPNPGPTVMIVGGMHGSETAGWRAARDIARWHIDAGTLVVLPEANKDAVRRDKRTGRDGRDLNRQFPAYRTPTTALARSIWAVVQEFKPDVLLDLHEGWGLRRLGHRFPGGTLSVGQTLIAYPHPEGEAFARYVIKYLDTYHVQDRRYYSFMLIGPPISGSLAAKAGTELGIPTFIAEPSQQRTALQSRIRWHKVIAEQLLRWYGLIDPSRPLIVPRAYRTTVELDVSPSPIVFLGPGVDADRYEPSWLLPEGVGD